MSAAGRSRTALLLLLGLLLSGCGGGGGADGGGAQPPAAATPPQGQGSNPTENEDIFQAELAYQEGLQTCSFYPLDQVAKTYKVEPTPKAVADAVAAAKEGSAAAKAAIRRGCLDALKGAAK